MHFVHPDMLLWLLLLPLFWMLDYRMTVWRRRAAAKFSAHPFSSHLIPSVSLRRQWLKNALWSLALAGIIMGLARPQGAPKLVYRTGQSLYLYLVLDCSLSMRARDVKPDRFTAAKQTLSALVERLAGDHIGLIGFAGTARVFCPATMDHHALLLALKQAGPEVLGSPGSNPAVGLALALEKLEHLPGKCKAVVILSDGEENRSENLAAMAQKASQQGIKVYTAGYGSEDGAPIPIGQDFWKKTRYRIYRGKTVKTRLVSIGLLKAAKLGQGRYWLFETQRITAYKIALELEKLTRQAARQAAILEYREFFPWLAVLAFVLLWLEPLLPLRRGAKK
jgi:Ca-activated chloride channel family protein